MGTRDTLAPFGTVPTVPTREAPFGTLGTVGAVGTGTAERKAVGAVGTGTAVGANADAYAGWVYDGCAGANAL